ncbi:AGAP010705-PA, partial [Anopheles gambiae str. PEST]
PHHQQQQQPQQPQNNLNISRRSASAEPVHGQEEVNGDDGLYGRNIHETEQEISFVTFTSKNITLEALRTSL